MKKNWFKKLFGGIFLIVVTLVSVGAICQSSAKASMYPDGTYVIHVHPHKSGTTADSMAKEFFNPTANVSVHDDIANVTMNVIGLGSKFLTSTKLQPNGVEVLSSDHQTLNFSVPISENPVQVEFHVAVGAGLQEPCDLLFDWSDINSQLSSDSSSSSLSTFTVSDSASSSSSTSSISSSGSSSSSQSVINPGTDQITKMNYSVLQADKKSISAANQYYTHAANIEKLNDGSYKVTMHVQYGKNSGMSAKGFVPLTVDGKKVSDVTYGSTDKDYTASFSFTVPNLDALTKAPVKGTIHVSVPTMDIGSDFDIYYLFTGATASDGTGTTSANSSAAAGTPSSSSQTPAKAVTATSKKTSSKLPQTSEIQNATIAVVGFLSLIMIVTTAIYRRKRV